MTTSQEEWREGLRAKAVERIREAADGGKIQWKSE
jgi:hypothetical protein